MARFVRRRGKTQLIRRAEARRAEARRAEAGQAEAPQTASQQAGSPSSSALASGATPPLKRCRHSSPSDDDDQDPHKAFTHTTDLDQAELAEILIESIENGKSIIEPSDFLEKAEVVAEDLPHVSELRDLLDYQDRDEAVDSRSEEAEDIDDNSDTDTPDAEDQFSPVDADPFLGSSTPIKHTRKDHQMNNFSLALGFYCIQQGVSRKQYSMLLEIFGLLRTDGISKINSLPATVDTLKRRVREQMPLFEMRSKQLILNPDKLPSSRIYSAAVAGRSEVPKQEMTFLNPIGLFSRILSSELSHSMHFGMAKLVDNPSEAWHSMQWAASIRTTSGDFAWYPPFPSNDPILPGDGVNYKCARIDCFCRETDEALNDPTRHHTGQIQAIYRDYRTGGRPLGMLSSNAGAIQGIKGEIVLVVGRIWEASKLIQLNVMNNTKVQINPLTDRDLSPGELILSIDPLELISSYMIISRAHIYFDYSFESKTTFADDLRPSNHIVIRRVFNYTQSYFMPVCKVSPVPGALEVE
ncbi:hypothetical protein F4861DRAFT_544563, partial [Xylaria intraflava]